jgi:hypothetical protein
MISNRFNENLSARLYQEYSAKVHKEKLNKIKKRNWSMSFDYEPEIPPKSTSYLKEAHMKEVVRENKILFDRLTEISERKVSSDLFFERKSPRTLNFAVRKKNSERIVKENNSFIQRLIDRPSHFSVKQMRAEFETHQKYRENLSKQKVLQRIEKIVKTNPINSLHCLALVKSKQEFSLETKKMKSSESQHEVGSLGDVN